MALIFHFKSQECELILKGLKSHRYCCCVKSQFEWSHYVQMSSKFFPNYRMVVIEICDYILNRFVDILLKNWIIIEWYLVT